MQCVCDFSQAAAALRKFVCTFCFITFTTSMFTLDFDELNILNGCEKYLLLNKRMTVYDLEIYKLLVWAIFVRNFIL